MRKTITVFGLIAGCILAAFLCISIPAFRDMDASSMATSMFVGYTVQLLTFSLIFFAIRQYRDKHNQGVVSFGRAFAIGLWISLIGSAFYVITWAIVYHTLLPDFMDKMEAMQLQAAAQSGASAEKIAAIKKQVAEGKQLYSTWWGFAGITLAEILPTGLVVTLVSALILKRKTRKELRPGL
jgi:hypothetical protein